MAAPTSPLVRDVRAGVLHDDAVDGEGPTRPPVTVRNRRNCSAVYRVYDVTRNEGWVSVGIDHDTAEFAVSTIRQWWRRMGQPQYKGATALYVTADGGGSNGARNRLWKSELQRLADDTGLTIHVSHLPPGTSKWNKIEHRLFGQITTNWRGKPLVTLEAVVALIANTTTKTGLKVRAAADQKRYPTGKKITDTEMGALALTRSDFHGEWNYSFTSRKRSSDS